MEPPAETGERITTIDQAESIMGLGKIKVEIGQKELPLLNQRQIMGTGAFYTALINNHPTVSIKSFEEAGNFLQQPGIQQTIRDVHSQIYPGTEKGVASRMLLTSLMLYPLMHNLITSSPDAYPDIFRDWKEDWIKGIDPEKFHVVMSIFFQALAKTPKNVQEEFIPNLKDKPLRPEEADFLTGVFENIYGKIHDVENIRAADKRNRELVDQIVEGKLKLTSNDLFHTTGLDLLPNIVDKGLLAMECTSLTQDGHNEAHYAVSFHTFQDPPSTVAELGEEFSSGRQETVQHHEQKIHLAFLNPQSSVDDQLILYPPDSFWFDREQRSDKVAGRYIAGYDSRSSDYPNKSIAYVLIGLPSPALSFVILDEKLKDQYAAEAQKLSFYIPAYSYEGKLLYTPQEFDQQREAVQAKI